MALREALAKHKIGIFMQCIHVVHISVSWRPTVPMGWGGYGLLGVIVHLLTPLGLCFLGDHFGNSLCFVGKGERAGSGAGKRLLRRKWVGRMGEEGRADRASCPGYYGHEGSKTAGMMCPGPLPPSGR